MSNDEAILTKEWYVVQSIPGCENAAKNNLERRIKSLNMQDRVFNVLIPEVSHKEKKKNGEEKIVVEKVYPGYLFVEMICDEDTWFMVRNTPMVTGFLGSSGGGSKPVPLLDEEINPILKACGINNDKPFDCEVGDTVLIKSGPFVNSTGKVGQINLDSRKVYVLVDVFGRESSVELDFDEVEKQN